MSPRYRREDAEQAEIEDLVNASASTFKGLNRQIQIAIIVLLVVAAIVAAIFYFRSRQTSRTCGFQSVIRISYLAIPVMPAIASRIQTII